MFARVLLWFVKVFVKETDTKSYCCNAIDKE